MLTTCPKCNAKESFTYRNFFVQGTSGLFTMSFCRKCAYKTKELYEEFILHARNSLHNKSDKPVLTLELDSYEVEEIIQMCRRPLEPACGRLAEYHRERILNRLLVQIEDAGKNLLQTPT